MISTDWLENSLKYLPWLMLVGAMAPTIVLALAFRIFPTRRWLVLFGPITGVSLLTVWMPSVATIILLLDIVAVIVVVVDLLTLTHPSRLRVERTMKRVASLAKPHDVVLLLSNLSNWTHRLDVRDDQPDGLAADPPEQQITIPAGKRAEVPYRLQAHRRGEFQLEKVFFRMHSLLGFWVRFLTRPAISTLQVYPDMKQLAEYAMLARTNRLSLIGVRRTRIIGQDNNFERLRDYNVGDNYKHIDWRSTARRQKLTVKQFQSDHSQRIVFLVDCGRMMTNEFEGLSLVDYAFNSMLMLSYVALQQRDSVGLLCFSDRVHDYVPLQSGGSHMNRLLHASFDRFPSMVQSRFDSAFLHFSNHCRRRSMVVLITNVIDEVSANQVTDYLTNLSGRHLPVLALLRDHRIFDYADYPDLDDSVLYRSAAAAQMLIWRNEVIRRMQRQGVLVVDAFPEQLTSPLVNQYLEAKAKHLL
ncbi:MAG: DUF58 domain-containing protein [Pirellulaceae bacterium]|nr:DUF58 domain-containing protein [Pirellulaceae bacterium]